MVESSKAIIDDKSMPIKRPFQDLSVEEILNIPLEACKGVQETGKEIVDINTTFITIEDKKYFYFRLRANRWIDC